MGAIEEATSQVIAFGVATFLRRCTSPFDNMDTSRGINPERRCVEAEWKGHRRKGRNKTFTGEDRGLMDIRNVSRRHSTHLCLLELKIQNVSVCYMRSN